MDGQQFKTVMRVVALAGRDRILTLWIAGMLGETRVEMAEALKNEQYFGPAAESPNRLREVILRLEGVTWRRPAEAAADYPLANYLRFSAGEDDGEMEGGEAA